MSDSPYQGRYRETERRGFGEDEPRGDVYREDAGQVRARYKYGFNNCHTCRLSVQAFSYWLRFCMSLPSLQLGAGCGAITISDQAQLGKPPSPSTLCN